MINLLKQKKLGHILLTCFFLVGIILLSAILGKGLTLNPDANVNALLGKQAKNFNVNILQGTELFSNEKKKLTLDDLKGAPLVLNFWASWCVSCRQEASTMEAFWRANKDSDLLMLGIAIQDSPEEAMKFAKYFGKTYLLGLDEDGKASIDYGVTGVPETFFIDVNGRILHKESGPVTFELMEKWLPLMKKKSDSSI